MPDLEFGLEIECDLCERRTRKYVFVEEDGLFICDECYQRMVTE